MDFMGLIAEYRITSPLLQETMQSFPEMTLEMEDMQVIEGDTARYIFWATDVSISELESALETDSTISDFVMLAKVGQRALYRVTFTDEARPQLTYPTASKCDIVFLSLVQSAGESTVRAQVPSRDALKILRNAYQKHDIPFTLDFLYRETADESSVRYGLTDAQSEALLLAYQAGYFTMNRDCTLEELSNKLDISRQAFAARLRRGHEQLIENTIV